MKNWYKSSKIFITCWVSLIPGTFVSYAQIAQEQTLTGDTLSQNPLNLPPKTKRHYPSQAADEAANPLPNLSLAEMKQQSAGLPAFAMHVQMLNKRTDKKDDYHLSQGEGFLYGGMYIQGLNCISSFKSEPGNDVGFVVMTDIENNIVFSGWLFSEFPGVSGLEHPQYDIRLISCQPVENVKQ